MPKMVERVCQCGKKYMAREADIKRGWGKSCSKSCAARRSNAKTGKYEKFLCRNRIDDEELGHPFESGFFGHGQE